jgi:phage-related protein
MADNSLAHMPKQAYSNTGMGDGLQQRVKPVRFLGDSQRVLRSFPGEVQGKLGYGLYQAQIGKRSPLAKPLNGFSPAVTELVSDCRGDTYRAVYTVKLAETVYVLHVFQKKSKHGIETPKPDLDLITQRLRLAVADAAQEK